ncbi:PhzF family phenazine biosynthesis protein [Streptomyces sp. RFCAC02]|uniref:PhzF family phenazine biosynthesis protein n=1 Tax=Streptomyces sp. RFCAC02 TaxID=2499143 RepID=UPI001020225B|nr:PhzF family phenazine biosynthesis protein [Streptomyces sp. RFCAC02]
MRRYAFVLADVFTERAFGGNQLAVLPDARGLSDGEMQALAREFNFSETAFVLPPDDTAHTRRLRIFTPETELPFAGHPTVGAAAVLVAREEARERLLLEEGVGLVTVDVSGTFARLTVTSPYEAPDHYPSVPAVAAALSLAPEDIVETWYGGVGLRFCYVRVADRAAVDRAVLDRAAWRSGVVGGWSGSLYVFAGHLTDGGRLHARSFAAMLDGGEDPATGSACAGLVAALAQRGGCRAPSYTLRVDQGVAMGRPSDLEAVARTADGELASVSVGGHTVLVGEGTITLPDA